MRFRLLLLLFLFAVNTGSTTAQCDTSRWKACWVTDDYKDTLSPVLNATTFINGGFLKVPFSLSNQQYCINTYCPKTRISFKDTLCITDNFSLEVKLRNTPAEQGFDAYDVGIEINGSGGNNYGCVLMGNAWARRFTSVYAGSKKMVDKPELVMNLKDWTVIQLRFVNHIWHYLKDGIEFYQLPYAGNVCTIVGLSFLFKGSGSIDWVKIKDATNQMVYEENFNDCRYLSRFSSDCKDSIHLNADFRMPNCGDNRLQLFASSNTGLAYYWTGPNGFTSEEQNPVIAPLSSSMAGTYILAGRLNSCTPPAIKTVQVQFKLPKTFIIDTTVCNGQNVGGHSRTGLYTDTFSSAGGCDSIRTIKLTVLPPPHPDLGSHMVICNGDVLTLSPGSFTSYQWQDGSTDSSLAVQQPGIYTVSVANKCGTAKAQVVVTTGDCNFYFPTAFTPNADGKNEGFRILNPDHAYPIKNYELVVYNRWGQKVFETTDYAKAWDGSFNGKPQQTGFYIWYCTWVKPGNYQRILRKGTVMLMR